MGTELTQKEELILELTSKVQESETNIHSIRKGYEMKGYEMKMAELQEELKNQKALLEEQRVLEAQRNKEAEKERSSMEQTIKDISTALESLRKEQRSVQMLEEQLEHAERKHHFVDRPKPNSSYDMSGTSNNADPLPKVVVSEVVDEKRKKSVGKEMKEIAKSLVKNEKGITVLMSYRKKIYSEERKEDEHFEYFSTTISESLGKFFSVVKKDVNEAIRTIWSASERIERLLKMLGNIPQNASEKMEMFKNVADEMKVLAQLLEKETEEADHFIWSDFNNDDGDDDDDEDSVTYAGEHFPQGRRSACLLPLTSCLMVRLSITNTSRF
ncbi:hypothetical protein L5515_015425 [Caenorhabditis briggsae]|uniref:Uncharacterized protein n=1 Tax=Caenorhabditis briggsae TaxID=6238 RepID=A0AAE9EER6_CAEBR|nr:hypothetical protein L5515_015425 [Caenorhabditis briggsae]